MFSFNFGANQETLDVSSCDEECESVIEIKLSEKNVSLLNSNDNASCYSFDSFEIKCLTRESIDKSLQEDVDLDIKKAEDSHSDLVTGVYEGGLKIWECAFDLGKYIVQNDHSVFFKDSTVLDLGCGTGLLGIIALKLGACHVDFQDFNAGVIKHVTIPNVSLNCAPSANMRFWYGDWKDFSKNKYYDVILTSETIYNTTNYNKLHRLFKRNLKPNGVILLAAKSYYFGVGGSVSEFVNLVKKKNVFNYKHVWHSDEGVKREIVELKFRE